jgi:hypothetical protein
MPYHVCQQVAMDVSRSFHQRYPGINLDSEQFSIVSKLFQEAVQSYEQNFVIEVDIPGGKSSTLLQRISRPRLNMGSQPIGTSATIVVGTCT